MLIMPLNWALPGKMADVLNASIPPGSIGVLQSLVAGDLAKWVTGNDEIPAFYTLHPHVTITGGSP
jgi:hypothetical protein